MLSVHMMFMWCMSTCVVHVYLCGACVCAYVYSCGAYIYLCGARVINDVMMIDLHSYGARELM